MVYSVLLLQQQLTTKVSVVEKKICMQARNQPEAF